MRNSIEIKGANKFKRILVLTTIYLIIKLVVSN